MTVSVVLVAAASEYAAVISERIRDAITRIEFAPEVAPLPLSISIGVATSLTGSQQLGVSPLIALFIIGLVLLLWVKPDGAEAEQ